MTPTTQQYREWYVNADHLWNDETAAFEDCDDPKAEDNSASRVFKSEAVQKRIKELEEYIEDKKSFWAIWERDWAIAAKEEINKLRGQLQESESRLKAVEEMLKQFETARIMAGPNDTTEYIHNHEVSHEKLAAWRKIQGSGE